MSEISTNWRSSVVPCTPFVASEVFTSLSAKVATSWPTLPKVLGKVTSKTPLPPSTVIPHPETQRPLSAAARSSFVMSKCSVPVVWPLKVSVNVLTVSTLPSRMSMCSTSDVVPRMPCVFVLIAIRSPELSSAPRSICPVEMTWKVSLPVPPTIDAIRAGDCVK